MSKLLRVDLPDAIWDRLNQMAEDHGQKIGAYVKTLLMAEAMAAEVPDQPVPDHPVTVSTPATRRAERPLQAVPSVPTADEYDRLVKWIRATDRLPPLNIKSKSALMAWAKSKGFKP